MVAKIHCNAKILITIFILDTVAKCVNPQSVNQRSPCPQIFTYDQTPSETGRWYGTIQVNSDVTLYGIWVDIILDQEAESIGNWFGDVSSTNNIEYKIENKGQIINAYTPSAIRFYVNYNTLSPTPKLRFIRLNGRQICSSIQSNPTRSPSSDRNTNNRQSQFNANNGISNMAYDALPLNNNENIRPISTNSRDDKSNEQTNTPTNGNVAPIANNDDNEIRNYDQLYKEPSSSLNVVIEENDYAVNTYNQPTRQQPSKKQNDGTTQYETPSSDTTIRKKPSSSSGTRDQGTNYDNDYNNNKRQSSATQGGSIQDNYNNRPSSSSSLSSGQGSAYPSSNQGSNDFYIKPSERKKPTQQDASTQYGISDVEKPSRRVSASQSSSENSRPQSSRNNDNQESRNRPTNQDNYNDNQGSRNRPTNQDNYNDNQGSRNRPTNQDNYNNNQGSRLRPLSQDNSNTFGSSQSGSVTRKPSTTTQSYDSEDYDYADTGSSSNKNKGSHDYFEGDFRLPPGSKISPTPLPSSSSSDNTCGKVAVRAKPLIVGGQTTDQGQWPWHVAIYQSQTAADSKYICGGSLISTSHVITAAHCVSRKSSSRTVNPQTLTLYLGKYNLRKSSDSVQIMLVRNIYIHPQYNSSNFYADLAILKFTKPSEYTNYVRPICLWKESEKDLSNVIDKDGTVVGWGFDENGKVTEELTLVKMPVVKQATCLWSFKEFYTHFTSEQSYCAGYENGTSVCNGDSGGGMVFPDANDYGSSPTWRLRGIVSISVAKQYEYRCDPYHYVVFTDVAQFLEWVNEKMSQ